MLQLVPKRYLLSGILNELIRNLKFVSQNEVTPSTEFHGTSRGCELHEARDEALLLVPRLPLNEIG
jgi:hypothetical protein